MATDAPVSVAPMRITRLEAWPYLRNAVALAVVFTLAGYGLGYLEEVLAPKQPGKSLSPGGLGHVLGQAGPAALAVDLVAALAGVGAALGAFNLIARFAGGFRVRFVRRRKPVEWPAGTYEVAQIAPGSAVVPGAVVGAGGLFVFMLVMTASSLATDGLNKTNALFTAGMAIGVPLMGGLWLAVVGGLVSLVYSGLASLWGGVRFTLATPQPADPAPDPTLPPAGPWARLSHVGIWQAGLLAAGWWLVFGTLLDMAPSLGVGLRLSGGTVPAPPGEHGLAAVASTVWGALEILTFVFVAGGAAALAHNLVAARTGGLEVRVQPVRPPDRAGAECQSGD